MLALFPERLLLILDDAGDDSTTSSIVTSQAVPEPSQEVETITQVMDQHIHDECEFIEVPFHIIFMRVYAFCTGAKFIPLFISYTYSRYDDNKVVWKRNVTQEDALAFSLDHHDDDDTMEIVQVTIIDNPTDDAVVHPMNPCHYDNLIFCGFEFGKSSLLVSVVISHHLPYVRWCCNGTCSGCRETSSGLYSKDGRYLCLMPVCIYPIFCLLGANFEIMKHCQNSSDGKAVCLMCVALNGYHNEESKYTWKRDVANSWIILDDEIHPIIYTTLGGKYNCQVRVGNQEILGAFDVKSKFSQL